MDTLDLLGEQTASLRASEFDRIDDRLASLVLSYHEDHHEGVPQWCHQQCRMAREILELES